MRAILVAILAGALFCAGCGAQPKPTGKTSNKSAGATTGHPLTAPVDYVGAVGKARRTAASNVDIAALNQAIQLFHASEDRFPQHLNELVEKQYLPRLPAPPPGSRLAYDPRTGSVRFIRQ